MVRYFSRLKLVMPEKDVVMQVKNVDKTTFSFKNINLCAFQR